MKKFEKQNTIVGHWSYCDRYTFQYLALNKNLSFNYYYSSCKGDHKMSGIYALAGDTIILKDTATSKESKILRRGDKLFEYAGKNGEYPDFQPITKTNKDSQKKAYKECQRCRKQIRKGKNEQK